MIRGSHGRWILGDRYQLETHIQPHGSGARFRHAAVRPRRWRGDRLIAKPVLAVPQEEQRVLAAGPDRALAIDEQDGDDARRETHLGPDRLPTNTVEASEVTARCNPQRAVRRLGKPPR